MQNEEQDCFMSMVLIYTLWRRSNIVHLLAIRELQALAGQVDLFASQVVQSQYLSRPPFQMAEI